MMDKHGAYLAEAIGLLSEVKWVSYHTQERAGEINILARQQICRAGQDAILKAKRACIMSDMDNIIPELDRLSNEFSALISNQAFEVRTVSLSVKHLISRLKDDLENEFYFHLDQRDVALYGQKELFGKRVSQKFGKSISDIECAGNCLALQQPTACVFHLMRVMEAGVKRLGSKLKVLINPEIETWNKILDHVNTAINGSSKRNIVGLPSKTEAQKKRKANYAEAYTYLHNVKLAWRNEVMHPKDSYTSG